MWPEHIPLSYTWRNLKSRKLTTGLAAAGMALVVFVFACVLMLSEGIKATLIQTGEDNNVVLIRKGSGTEIQSAIDREQAAIVETTLPIAQGTDGQRLISQEPVVLITLLKRDVLKPSNVTIRGIKPAGIQARPQVRLVSGRWPQAGMAEVVTGRAMAGRFVGGALGEHLRFAQRDWQVVGSFDAGGSGFDSEIWGDSDTLMQAFRRQTYSALVFRLIDGNAFDSTKAALESDPRLNLEAKRETQFYADQSAALSTFIRILGLSLSVIFSIGAIVGAMITMYATVSNRTPEIGTLRALGFSRRSILQAFLMESLLLSLLGGVAGLLAASLMQNIELSTMNWQTFSEVAFGFTLTVDIVFNTLLFALTMGLAGGFLPALRASRLKIVDALRAR
jgi:ABC-type antimicrobial peptide transport system permease subunit